MAAVSLWVAANALLMLGLALNVTRHRLNTGQPGYDDVRLDKAIRAHGNNIEYVPIILLMLYLLGQGGFGVVWIHALGATLFVARALHAHGIQVVGKGLPRSRVAGNLGTWAVMLACAILLLIQFVTSQGQPQP